MNPKASLAIGIVCIAFSPIFVKLAGVPGVTSGFYRIFIAWLFLAPYCIIQKKLKIDRKALITSIIGGLVFASDIAIWNISLLKISATVSTLIANLAPLWVGLISFLLLRKRYGKLFWIGTIVAIAGMAILVGFEDIIGLKFNVGILLALLASLFYAVYILITGGVMQQIGTTTFMFYNMLSASLFLGIVCLFMPNGLAVGSTNAWPCLFGLGIICQLAGWITINYSLGFLEPGKVSIALLAQTVLAGILATFMLHETLDFNEIVGSVIVLGGIAITFLKPKRAKI